MYENYAANTTICRVLEMENATVFHFNKFT